MTMTYVDFNLHLNYTITLTDDRDIVDVLIGQAYGSINHSSQRQSISEGSIISDADLMVLRMAGHFWELFERRRASGLSAVGQMVGITAQDGSGQRFARIKVQTLSDSVLASTTNGVLYMQIRDRQISGLGFLTL